MSDGERVTYTGRFLEMRFRETWEFVTRTNASAVVAIAARTPADEVVLVEQYRKPLGRRVVELPAGLVGDDGDHDLLASARRELEEEAGFTCERCTVLTEGPSSSGLTDEVITFVRAEGLSRIGPGGGVDGEDITTHLVPQASVQAFLAEKAAAGLYVDPKVWIGLFYLGLAYDS
jgi:ADP-ribose pyrophosphatase